ncbi:MAG: hypothetical protein CMJ89_09835 [Planctomycetes bacterium]|jgi:superfamily I DNA/RNA helicase|nr:hypothetical protein [Planctomycetota bacterium]
MQDFLSVLNPEQRRAVETTEGPLLVLAGAGTGKTRVITVRIAHLLSKGVAPERILAVTFTNKAAREMRERVSRLVGKVRAQRLFCGTFHSFCMELLREYGEALEISKRFTISDGSDQISILRGALREISVGGVQLQPHVVQSRISLMKNQLVQTKSFFDGAADDEEELIARAWERYDEALRKARSLDFDDLLLYTLRLLRLPGGPIESVRNRFHYVLVDEYQDTNAPQYGIVREVTGERKNICVVGDDDQSIYGWRGADVSKILNFQGDFPGAEVVRLETNYRSTEQILDAANKVIENNPRRHKKTLRSAIGPGDPLQLVIADDEHEEADHIACQIQDMVRDEETRWGDVAVLFRTGPQARPFEAQFRARSIPYVLVGGRSFFDRKEVRDVLSYLKLIVNPSDEVALLRAVSAPPRGLGKTSLDRLLSFAVREGLTALEAFERAPEVEGVQKAQGLAAREFALLMATLSRREGPVPARIESILQAVDYRREVDRSYPDELTREQRWNGVEEIVVLAENHQRTKKVPSLEAFLQELALTADDDESPEDASKRDRVVLMTLHAAKGLEFPRVYLVGLEEGLLPHSRALAEGNVEEERRLAYVGLTRAKSYLTLSHTRQRMRHGHSIETLTSRFLYELRGEEPPKVWHDAVDVLQPQKSRRKTRRKGRKKAAKKRTRR